jgi:hypothetical protein
MEYRFQGGLNYARGFDLECRVIAPKPHSGKHIRVRPLPSALDVKFGTDGLDEVGQLHIHSPQPEKPELSARGYDTDGTLPIEQPELPPSAITALESAAQGGAVAVGREVGFAPAMLELVTGAEFPDPEPLRGDPKVVRLRRSQRIDGAGAGLSIDLPRQDLSHLVATCARLQRDRHHSTDDVRARPAYVFSFANPAATTWVDAFALFGEEARQDEAVTYRELETHWLLGTKSDHTVAAKRVLAVKIRGIAEPSR